MALKFGLDLNYREVVDYGPMFVNPKYVGNKLQYQMLQKIDKYSKMLGYKYAVGTIHPDNKYSIALSEIPENIEQYLLKAKGICEMSHPARDRKLDAFSEFSETLKFINTLEYGLISIAHPARINTNYINTDLFSFFNEFWNVYKTFGAQRAYAYEKYYQSYSASKHFERLTAIDETAKKYGLAYTGGIDSHGYGICSRA